MITIDQSKLSRECLEKRTLNAKTFYNGNGSYVVDCYNEHIHYKDKNEKEFKDIDTTLVPTDYGWEMRKASYEVEIPKYADDWFRFINSFILDPRTLEEHNLPEEYINMRPVGVGHIEGKLITDNDDWKNKKVVYTDAFGNGIDLVIQTRDTDFDKLVVIRNKPKEIKDLQFQFEIHIPDEYNWKYNSPDNNNLVNEKIIYSRKLTKDIINLEKNKNIVTAREKNKEKMVLQGEIEDNLARKNWNKLGTLKTTNSIIVGNLKKTWFRDFRVWDSIGKEELINVEISKDKDFFRLTKTITKEFLEKAIFPVYTDETNSYGCATTRGYVYNQGTVWNTVRTAATGAGRAYYPSNMYLYVYISGTTYYLYRNFFSFYTAPIPDGSTISAATAYFYFGYYNKSGAETVNIVSATPASYTNLAVEDYDQVGVNTICDTAVDVQTGDGKTNAFILNATGISAISQTGYTCIAVLSQTHDIDNSAPADGVRELNDFRLGGTNYISITYNSSNKILPKNNLRPAIFSPGNAR